MESREEYLLLVKLAYNQVIHTSIGMTLFKCVYSFWTLTPLYLTTFSSYIVISIDEKKRVDGIRNLHEKVRLRLEK